ncbi:hypothetical protein [Pseudomonas sp. JR33AA]|uniref:hypothetical protein n=1 Tax=Pseudomonas sp. JR33AA TaxID=2899113 RepID=UPI001F4285A3|nr:hypothetical protein [Pseudomonas sp. JR33AA]MCE5975380.1 hypothetical protein [Pseudomonas sp. JR33AA]
MHANYTLWLNGNSLVLIDNSITASCAEALLDVQLAAYLTANKGHAIQDAVWQKEYLRIQGNFGCTLATLHASAVPAAPAVACEPWKVLRANLLAGMPSALQGPVATCLDAYSCQPDDAIEQLLWAECVRPPDDKGVSHVRMELRLILADAGVITTALAFSTTEHLATDWLWQPLNLASAHATQQFDANYFIHEKVISSISAGLHDSIKVKQLQYRSQVKFAKISGVENE